MNAAKHTGWSAFVLSVLSILVLVLAAGARLDAATRAAEGSDGQKVEGSKAAFIFTFTAVTSIPALALLTGLGTRWYKRGLLRRLIATIPGLLLLALPLVMLDQACGLYWSAGDEHRRTLLGWWITFWIVLSAIWMAVITAVFVLAGARAGRKGKEPPTPTGV